MIIEPEPMLLTSNTLVIAETAGSVNVHAPAKFTTYLVFTAIVCVAVVTTTTGRADVAAGELINPVSAFPVSVTTLLTATEGIPIKTPALLRYPRPSEVCPIALQNDAIIKS
jgi:hypothetical protein